MQSLKGDTSSFIIASGSVALVVFSALSFMNVLVHRKTKTRDSVVAGVSTAVAGKPLGQAILIAQRTAPGWSVLTRPINGSPTDPDPASTTLTLVYSGDKVIAVE